MTPPKNKKNKKLRERVGAVGAVEDRGVGCLAPTGGKDAITKTKDAQHIDIQLLTYSINTIFYKQYGRITQKRRKRYYIYIYY